MFNVKAAEGGFQACLLKRQKLTCLRAGGGKSTVICRSHIFTAKNSGIFQLKEVYYIYVLRDADGDQEDTP